MRKLLKKISDLKNAYRVLEVMDKAGCDIEQVSNMNGYYKLKPKWYVSERDAKDLQKIVLHKKNYYGNHCILHSLAVANAFQSGRSAEHNGRPFLIN